MTGGEILRHIDAGAVFYLDFFADAAHMDTVDKNAYRYTRPKDGEQGIRFAYDVRLDGLPEEEARSVTAWLKSCGMPVWWPLSPPIAPPGDESEFYMFLLPEDKPVCAPPGVPVRQVKTPEDFAVFAKLNNDIFAGGYQDMHPQNHYPWVKSGKLIPYIAHEGNRPVAIAAILNNNGVASLEFVGTLEPYRGKGRAKALCARAIDEAFASGAKIITLRAFHPARLLYEKLGFQVCVC